MGSGHGKGIPLALMREGEIATVAGVRGGEEAGRHLESLGFVSGSSVRLVSSSGGDVIVQIRGARLGLDIKTAARIMVV